MRNETVNDGRWSRLTEAHSRYLAAASSHYDEVFDEVSRRIQDRGNIGKADIGALSFWKRLRADAPWVRRLHATSEDEVRHLTGRAVDVVRNPALSLSEAAGTGRAALSVLPGFDRGDALASALLTAAAPDRMAVYDQRAQRALDMLNIRLSAARGRYRNYLALIENLLQDAPPEVRATWRPRDVDLALYTLGEPPARQRAER